MNTLLLRKKMTTSARSTAPVKTGNLKYNGIYSMRTTKGFKIVWDRQYAHYINIQNEKYHKDFVRLGMLKATMELRDKQAKRTLRSKKEVDIRNSLPYFISQNLDGTTIDFKNNAAKIFKQLARSVKYMQEKEPNYVDKSNVVNYFEDGKIVDIVEYENTLIN